MALLLFLFSFYLLKYSGMRPCPLCLWMFSPLEKSGLQQEGCFRYFANLAGNGKSEIL